MTLPSRSSDAALMGRWIAARVRMTLRSPRALGFTFAFPLVLITLFNAINGGVKVQAMGSAAATCRSRSTTRPRSASSASPSACYTSLLIGARDRPRARAAQARARHAAAAARLPRLVDRRRDADGPRRGHAAVRGRGAGVRRRHLPAHAARPRS